MGKSEEREGLFGKYVEHYDDDGNKIGESREVDGFFGRYTEHRDASGRKVGESRDYDGLFGKYTEHRDVEDRKTGESREYDGFLGKYTEHTDALGRKTGTSRQWNGLFGRYTENEGSGHWPGPRSANTEAPSSASGQDDSGYSSGGSRVTGASPKASSEGTGRSGAVLVGVFLLGLVGLSVLQGLGSEIPSEPQSETQWTLPVQLLTERGDWWKVNQVELGGCKRFVFTGNTNEAWIRWTAGSERPLNSVLSNGELRVSGAFELQGSTPITFRIYPTCETPAQYRQRVGSKLNPEATIIVAYTASAMLITSVLCWGTIFILRHGKEASFSGAASTLTFIALLLGLMLFSFPLRTSLPWGYAWFHAYTCFNYSASWMPRFPYPDCLAPVVNGLIIGAIPGGAIFLLVLFGNLNGDSHRR